jgi:hypothetical protein
VISPAHTRSPDALALAVALAVALALALALALDLVLALAGRSNLFPLATAYAH